MKTLYSSKGLELTSELAKYANSKTAHLAKRIPRRARPSAVCTVAFSQVIDGTDKMSTCNIVLTLGGVKLESKETTQHMYAALDIAVVHIEQQIEEYLHAHKRSLWVGRKATN